MRNIASATEDDMISAFVLAEVDSPTFAPAGYEPWFRMNGLSLEQVRVGLRAGDARVLRLARSALADIRGFGRGLALFMGFPREVAWRRGDLSSADLAELRYCSFPSWVQLSAGSRRVTDGAAAVRSGSGVDAEIARKVKAIADDVRRGREYPPLIAIQEPDGPLILIEGHNRATAFVMAETHVLVPFILGTTKSLAGWRWR